MLSGIGPADHLESHDIDVTVDVPGVGRNLQDHLRVMVSYRSPEPIDMIEQRETRRSDTVLVGGFERSDPSLPAPDIQYGISAGIPPVHPPEEGFSVTAIPLRPTSTGYVELRSDDPFDDPVVDPQYFTTEKDLEDIVTCVRRARELLRTDVLEPYRGEEFQPGAEVTSDEAIVDYARELVGSGFHPTCMAKMGRDEMAVVDEALRVYGVEGLRVIDASVMPNVTGGNTNAPTMVIAENGADLVTATHGEAVRAD